MSRNVVLVTYDSLRADHCSFTGYERETTPTLDAMADEGVVFENAMASGVPTIASMTAVMTGEHSLASPELGEADAQREQVTSRRKLAEVLSASGYSTGALVPNPPASSHFGFDGGFGWFEDFLDRDRGVVERAWNRVFERSIEGGGLSTYLRLARNVLTKNEILRPWEDFYDRLLAWRERVEEPYFLWVLLLEPHHPWMPPGRAQQWSSRTDKYRAFKQYFEMFNNGWTPDFSPDERQRLVDLYDDSIRYGDEFLARLREDFGDDDPVIAVHADHGEEFGERGRYGHQPHLTEELTHVPLVLWNADCTGRVERPVGLRSIAPTIADIAGADHGFDAPGLLEAADGRARPWTISKVFAEGDRRTAVRTAAAKYLHANGQGELYRLRDVASAASDGGADVELDALDAFDDLRALHVADEQEKRSVRRETTELASGDAT